MSSLSRLELLLEVPELAAKLSPELPTQTKEHTQVPAQALAQALTKVKTQIPAEYLTPATSKYSSTDSAVSSASERFQSPDQETRGGRRRARRFISPVSPLRAPPSLPSFEDAVSDPQESTATAGDLSLSVTNTEANTTGCFCGPSMRRGAFKLRRSRRVAPMMAEPVATGGNGARKPACENPPPAGRLAGWLSGLRALFHR